MNYFTLKRFKQLCKINLSFKAFAKKTSLWVGNPKTFIAAIALIILWLLSGPFFGFNDTWQLYINTSTTVITFLVVFIIQNTQNRDTRAMQIKLDELIRATEGAHNALLDMEELEEEELEVFLKHYEKLAIRARKAIEKGKPDTIVVEVEKD